MPETAPPIRKRRSADLLPAILSQHSTKHPRPTAKRLIVAPSRSAPPDPSAPGAAHAPRRPLRSFRLSSAREGAARRISLTHGSPHPSIHDQVPGAPPLEASTRKPRSGRASRRAGTVRRYRTANATTTPIVGRNSERAPDECRWWESGRQACFARPARLERHLCRQGLAQRHRVSCGARCSAEQRNGTADDFPYARRSRPASS